MTDGRSTIERQADARLFASACCPVHRADPRLNPRNDAWTVAPPGYMRVLGGATTNRRR